MIELQSNSLHFSKHIAVKYNISRKSDQLPALIFIRLFGKGIINKVTNIYRTELINNHFRLHLNFYLRMISQLNQILSHYCQSKKLPHSADSGRTKENLPSPLFALTPANPPECRKEWLHTPAPLSRGDISSLWQRKVRRDFIIGCILTYGRLSNSFVRLLHSGPQITAMTNVEHYFIKIADGYNRLCVRYPLSRGIRNLQNITVTGKTAYPFSHYSQAKSMSGEYGYKTATIFYEGNKLIKKDIYTTATENIYFHTQQKIEKEVQEIKKIINETKSKVDEKYTAANFSKALVLDTKHFDINRISDQVYKMIDHKFKIEKERRGHL